MVCNKSLTSFLPSGFDQMGVELGKVRKPTDSLLKMILLVLTGLYISYPLQVLAKAILPSLDGTKGVEGHDSSTTGLINYWLQHKL